MEFYLKTAAMEVGMKALEPSAPSGPSPIYSSEATSGKPLGFQGAKYEIHFSIAISFPSISKTKTKPNKNSGEETWESVFSEKEKGNKCKIKNNVQNLSKNKGNREKDNVSAKFAMFC